jgi:putative tryptophan/tyrosine transport system substrate-binding protein
MRRRTFISLVGGAAAAWPCAARAQPSRVPRIGVLLQGTATSFTPRVQAFLEGLRDLGYVEGRTAILEWRWGEDRIDWLPELAAELVRRDVDVIVTAGTPAAKALKDATRTIPIVMAIVGDPVAAGLVESLARPGGNATGFSIVATDLSGRQSPAAEGNSSRIVFCCGDIEHCQSAIAKRAKGDAGCGANIGPTASFDADFR